MESSYYKIVLLNTDSIFTRFFYGTVKDRLVHIHLGGQTLTLCQELDIKR